MTVRTCVEVYDPIQARSVPPTYFLQPLANAPVPYSNCVIYFDYAAPYFPRAHTIFELEDPRDAEISVRVEFTFPAADGTLLRSVYTTDPDHVPSLLGASILSVQDLRALFPYVPWATSNALWNYADGNRYPSHPTQGGNVFYVHTGTPPWDKDPLLLLLSANGITGPVTMILDGFVKIPFVQSPELLWSMIPWQLSAGGIVIPMRGVVGAIPCGPFPGLAGTCGCAPACP